MNDVILASTDRQEALSRAYVAAVAASAGYTLAVQDFDRDGVDVQVRAGGTMRPSLDIQLKATSRLDQGREEQFRYPAPPPQLRPAPSAGTRPTDSCRSRPPER